MHDLKFLARNSLSSKDLFQTRTSYKKYAVPENSLRMLDFWYEDSLYGKVNSGMNAIYPIIDRARTLRTIPDNKDVVPCMFFITEALQELKQDYGFLISNSDGKIKALPGYDQFQVVSSYVSFEGLYEEHLANMTNYFVKVYLKRHSKCIKNFQDILFYYKKFINYFGTRFPITKTNFILLPEVSPQVSGLIVNLAYSKNSEDFRKEEFFEECDFQALQGLASQKGFYMDKNNPWRLIIDIKSDKINEVRTSGDAADMGSGFNILNRYYYEAYKEDSYSVKRFIMNSYNLFWTLYPSISYSVERPNGRLQTAQKARDPRSPAGPSQLDPAEWMKYVHMTRISEINISEEKKREFHKEIEAAFREGRYHDSHNHPLIMLRSVNEDAKRKDPRFFQKLKPLPALHGYTTEDLSHEHIYELDKYGNGWALSVHHPDNPKIKHKHKIINFVVQESQSVCYPHCEEIYGTKGSKPHVHEILT